jgi:single-stranded DNA-binding protein
MSNRVELSGHIGTEVSLKYVGANGTAKTFCKLIVPDGEYGGKKREQWIPLTVWGESAETFANIVAKGSAVSVVGKYNVNKWKDQQDQWREDHGVTVFEFAAEASASMGSEVSEDDFGADVPF